MNSNISLASTPTLDAPSPGAILGIWRVGSPIESASHPVDSGQTAAFQAQPADSLGSNRWEYQLTIGQDSPTVRSQFEAFVRCAQTEHPNLVRVRDASVEAALPYIVTSSSPVTTWAQRQNEATQTLPVALWVIRQAAMAVAALHSAGWIHGRLEPAAISVERDGTAKLYDLRFASTIHSNRRLVQAARPPFASPELIAGNHATIPAMDVYSLGQVLFDSLRRTDACANAQTVRQTADLIESMVDPVADRRPTSHSVAGELLRLEMQSLSEHFGPTGLFAPLRAAA